MHAGVCTHGCAFLWVCFGVVWFGFFDVAFTVWPCLPGKSDNFLKVLCASYFSTISDPYQCFCSSCDTRAEIMMVEPGRIMLQKPPYCYQWISVLLQPTEIMVWAVCAALKRISVCRNIIKEWLKVHNIKEEFRTKNKRNFLECSTTHPRVSRRFSVQGWRAFLRRLVTVICSV